MDNLNFSLEEMDIFEIITEIRGNFKLWPYFIQLHFPRRKLKYWERICMVVFMYINDLDPNIAMEWIKLRHMARDKSAFRHFQYFFWYC